MSTHQPIKKFGQNFLTSERVVARIIEAVHVKPIDTIVEIGPGYGVLTFELAKRAKKIYAIEKDRNLVSSLRGSCTKRRITNVEVIEADIRDVSVSDILPQKIAYKLVGNIPYYITGFLFRKFLEEERLKPETIVFMVQKEVAERIVSREPRHSLISLSVQAYGTPKIIMSVSRSLFSPPPNVDSVVLAVSDISRDRFKKAKISEKHFFKILHAGFSHPRKLLVSNLASALKISRENVLRAFHDSNIKKEARASELSVKQWFLLAQNLELRTKNQNFLVAGR
jgi:16S rRNA (adenine1518-N6/adenine1519-N6)-dimethyltransferase